MKLTPFDQFKIAEVLKKKSGSKSAVEAQPKPLNELLCCDGCGVKPFKYGNDEFAIDHKDGCPISPFQPPIRMWITGKENQAKWNRQAT